MSTKEHDEQHLINRLLNRDEAAMKQFFNAYYSRLHYFSFQMIGNQEDAEDIVAEAFLNFWTNIRENKVTSGNLKAYLYRMVRNRCVNYLERKRMLESKNGEVIAQFYADVQQQMDQELFKADLFHRVKNNFSQLTPFQVKVMQLLYIEGADVQETARQLNTTANNVRNHKARALERLKSVLKGELIISIIFSLL